MRWLRYLLLLVLVAAVGASVLAFWVWRRALPQVDGTAHAPGLTQPVEIVRDRWGVPHIFAATDADAYRALGWAMAQDRLFQMDLLRHVVQGRLAELFGAPGVEVDKLFRTLDLPGSGRRMYLGTRPEVREALEAFAAGINAYLAELGSNLPPEYAILRMVPDRFQPDDLVAVVGLMTWDLNPAWRLDPLYERIAAAVGPLRAATLFPQHPQGALQLGHLEPPRAPLAAALPSLPATLLPAPLPSALLQPERFRLSAANEALLASLPSLRGSNSWAIAPARSATGHALLADDPHLGLAQPGTWYQAHLRTPQHEVIGVFVPGVPFAVIGHTREIAWGFVNLNLDAGDFFLERLDPARPGEVLHRGAWVPLRERQETIYVKGGERVALTVRNTPHGPLVHDLLKGQEQALSYRWLYTVATSANELNGFYDLNRARDWTGFRAALGKFGAVAQTATYADRLGHIGMQVSGRIPERLGRRDGLGYRTGWDGAEEWGGLLPFERNPSEFDPGSGYVAVANNPPAQPPDYYISGYFEPEDRIARIRTLLTRKERHSLDDMARIQNDIVFLSGQVLAPQVVAAFAAAPPREAATRAALDALRGWSGEMAMDSRGAAVFAVFYKHLFHEIFSDELDAAVLEGLRTKTNHSGVMMQVVLQQNLTRWLNRQDTPQVEGRADIFRAALGKAAAELVRLRGEDPSAWQWGELHQVLFQHPLGRVAALAPLFNVGPHPLPGHAQTVKKAQFVDESYRVYQGPSMRQLTDTGDMARALSVLPTGQSGIPASPHYADLFPLWRDGRYHPLLMERPEIDRLAEGRLVLQP